ncbi:MAG: hypothetical protein NVSMB24_07750 [Mucilaginibacter sp.]
MNALTETWQIHNRINLFLLENISEVALKDQSASKGRNVGEQFAHMHTVRMMWLKVGYPGLLEGLAKIEKQNITKQILSDELNRSGTAIETLFEKTAADNKIKGFKPHATAFLGYLISHESHHRGQIMLALKQSGHMVDQKTQYGIWDWGNKIGELPAGYSGTTLAKKMGIKPGFRIGLINQPGNYFDLFTDLPPDITITNDVTIKKDLIHIFTKSEKEFTAMLPGLKTQITPNGVIWVSWPKKASKVVTDITEDIIRNYALSIGLVDIKVCAVDETWSGLKLVIPVKERNLQPI